MKQIFTSFLVCMLVSKAVVRCLSLIVLLQISVSVCGNAVVSAQETESGTVLAEDTSSGTVIVSTETGSVQTSTSVTVQEVDAIAALSGALVTDLTGHIIEAPFETGQTVS